MLQQRKNSFDDSREIAAFKTLVKSDTQMREYISKFCNIADIAYIKDHPDGQTGIDVSLFDNDCNRLLNIDVECWSNFYLNTFRLFARKEKYLHKSTPFLLICYNEQLTKWLAVDTQTILKYPFHKTPTQFSGRNAFGSFKSGGRTLPRKAASIFEIKQPLL